jgi:hypothetical protein
VRVVWGCNIYQIDVWIFNNALPVAGGVVKTESSGSILSHLVGEFGDGVLDGQNLRRPEEHWNCGVSKRVGLAHKSAADKTYVNFSH